MKKKIIIMVSSVMALIVIAVVICMNLFSGSHTGINNDSESNVHGDSRILVAYFSWSGNGQQMARWILSKQEEIFFRIVPTQSYGEDYNACADRAKNELDNGIRPQISRTY